MAKRKTKRAAKTKTRKKAKPKSSAPRKLWLEGWWQKISDQTKRSALRGVLHLAAIVLIVTGVAYGLGRLENYVHDLDRYGGRIALVIEDVPEWLDPAVTQDLYERAEAEVDRLSDKHDDNGPQVWFDPKLAPNIAHALASNAYVAEVVQVDKQLREPSGEISGDPAVDGNRGQYAQQVIMRVKFRRPLAQVSYRGFNEQLAKWYILDENGVPLEELKTASPDLPKIRNSPPRWRRPQLGRALEAPDVLAGLELLALLRDEPFYRDEIVPGWVDVTNFGRPVPRQAELVLLVPPDRPNGTIQEIGWGHHVNSPEKGEANTVQQKLVVLRKLYRNMGTLNLMDRHRERYDLFREPGQPWYEAGNGVAHFNSGQRG